MFLTRILPLRLPRADGKMWVPQRREAKHQSGAARHAGPALRTGFEGWSPAVETEPSHEQPASSLVAASVPVVADRGQPLQLHLRPSPSAAGDRPGA